MPEALTAASLIAQPTPGPYRQLPAGIPVQQSAPYWRPVPDWKIPATVPAWVRAWR